MCAVYIAAFYNKNVALLVDYMIYSSKYPIFSADHVASRNQFLIVQLVNK